MFELTIDGLDLSYAGSSRSGIGIYADQFQRNLVIQNVTATNRGTGFQLTGGGQDLTLIDNDLSGNNTALYVQSFTDGADTGNVDNSVPIIASGNVVTNSNTGMQLFNMSGQFVGITGTGIIVDNVNDGFQTVSGNAFYLRNFDNSTFEGVGRLLDRFRQSIRRGYLLVTRRQTIWTIQNVIANNRSEGVRYDSGSNVTIQDSEFVNNTTGIYANSAGGSATVVVNNRIEGNSNGLAAQGGGTQVNAINNFWGPGGGPGVGGNNGFTGNALATPFLATAPTGTVPITFAVNTLSDVSDGDTSSIAALTLNPGTGGAISLREAIEAANNTPGTDTIPFAIGSGAATIVLTSALPDITDTVVLDGSSQPGYVGQTLITIDASALGVTALNVTAQNSLLKEFAITGGSGTALALSGADGTRLERLTLSGSGAVGTGLSVSGSTGVHAQDLTIDDRATGIDIVSSSSGVNVVTSTITNNTTGVSVDASTSGVSLNQNRIEGNGATTAVNNASATSVDAQFNYWGAGGDAGVGGNNGVTGTVDTTNFLAAIPEGIVATTLSVNTADDRSDGDDDQYRGFDRQPGRRRQNITSRGDRGGQQHDRGGHDRFRHRFRSPNHHTCQCAAGHQRSTDNRRQQPVRLRRQSADPNRRQCLGRQRAGSKWCHGDAERFECHQLRRNCHSLE